MSDWNVSPEEWASLREDIGHIKAKVEEIASIDERVRAVERNQWTFGGLAAMVGSLVGFFH